MHSHLWVVDAKAWPYNIPFWRLTEWRLYVDSGHQMKYVSDNWHLNTLGIICITFSWLLRQETKIQPGCSAENYAWQEWDMVTDHIMLRASLKSLQTIVTFITVAQQDCTQMCRDEPNQLPKKFEGKNCLLTSLQKTKNYAWQWWVGDCNLWEYHS
jgi:hypothetical protein